MVTTIDQAGRIVIPKPIRDRLGLRGGEQVQVEEREGEIVVSRPRPGARLVRTEHGLLTASPDAGLPGLGPDEVRELLERSRR
jgi:AbrB family looped-hinge helix DNA binding protein